MVWFSRKKKEEETSHREPWEDAFAKYIPRDSLDHVDSFLSTPPFTRNQTVIVGLASTFSFFIGYRLGRFRPVWRPVTSLQDLNTNDIGKGASWMRGTVASVSDGDTIRFLHQPIPWLNSVAKHDKSHRLAIRLCTIDTPETAKFGKPGMAFGQESKQHLEKLCLNRTVKIKILQRDQYGRGVAEVYRPGFLWNTYLDESMLKVGLAEVYEGSGAVYGRLGKKKYLELARKAKERKLGIWSNPNRETAAEYKRRTS